MERQSLESGDKIKDAAHLTQSIEKIKDSINHRISAPSKREHEKHNDINYLDN